jgi:hypothetical protein
MGPRRDDQPSPDSDFGSGQVPHWHGSRAELRRLRRAIRRNCGCSSASADTHGPECEVNAVLTDQCVLDHLLYVYRERIRFKRGEFVVAST